MEVMDYAAAGATRLHKRTSSGITRWVRGQEGLPPGGHEPHDSCRGQASATSECRSQAVSLGQEREFLCSPETKGIILPVSGARESCYLTKVRGRASGTEGSLFMREKDFPKSRSVVCPWEVAYAVSRGWHC